MTSDMNSNNVNPHDASGESAYAGSASDSQATGLNPEARTVALLQRIQSGQVHAKSITVDDRRLLVAYLISDGYSTAEVAQLLKVSDRSIERDKRAIRESNALPKDPRLVEQMTGRLVCEADLAIQRIRRAAREKSIPAGVKVDAEHRCYQIVGDVVQRLQGLGYLPTAAQRVEADLTHHDGDIPDLETLDGELQRLRTLTADHNGQVPESVSELEAEFQRASIAMKVQNVSAPTERPSGREVDHDEAG